MGKLVVAETILAQLGGSGRLAAMLGAHTFLGDATSLSFKIRAKAANGAKAIKIVLTPDDLYTVEFWSIRGLATKEVGHFEAVHVESLRALIEGETGLRLSLGTLTAAPR